MIAQLGEPDYLDGLYYLDYLEGLDEETCF